MESHMDFPAIKKFIAGFLRRMPGVAQAGFVDGGSDSAVPAAAAGYHDCPFVLVAHSAGGQWEVYAKDFEHPLASFDERQAGCDFARNLAETGENTIVLIREQQGSL
jgi:hypothetical protein